MSTEVRVTRDPRVNATDPGDQVSSTTVASIAAPGDAIPQLHRGTDHVHVPAVVTEIGRVALPSGRDLVFRHAIYGRGHSLDVVTIREDDRGQRREHHVRVPAGCLHALGAALAKVQEAHDRSVPGRRGVPRGTTTPHDRRSTR